MWACICYVVPEVIVFLLGFVRGFFFPHLGHLHLPMWFSALCQVSLIFFLVFLMRAIKCLFVSARISLSLPSNQPMKPTAPWRYNFSEVATDPARGLSLSR